MTAAGACCPLGTDVLDASGGCCAPELVDACGTCNGTAVAVDARGVCCDGQLDAAGICCPATESVDLCGVCGGVNACSQRLRLRTSIPSYLTATAIASELSPARVRYVTEIASFVTAARGVPAGRVVVGSTGIYHTTRLLAETTNEPSGDATTHQGLRGAGNGAAWEENEEAWDTEDPLPAAGRRLNHQGMWVDVTVVPPPTDPANNFVDETVLANSLQTTAAGQSMSTSFIALLHTEMTGGA